VHHTADRFWFDTYAKTDSNTLCITDIERWKLVTVGEVWVMAASFVLWTVKSEVMKNI